MLEYKFAGSDVTEPPMRNTIGTVKVGALTSDKFTNTNLEYIHEKVQQWSNLHFSKGRHPPPALGSHLIDIRVFDTVEGARCEYDQSTEVFQPVPPASAVHAHNSVHQLEILH